ncbi:MAG: SIMPL domain-containing protein [Acidobacteriia bacterium]|nr:SIMPL domain-containing protein [Terriglobia bacterium]
MKWTLLLLTLGISPGRIMGQTPAPRPPAVEVSADATVQVKPDQATLAIGIVTQAPTAQEAGAQNANQTQMALDKLRAAMGAGGTLRTLGYSINPVYSDSKNGQPTIRAYSANNTVQVTTSDLAGLGKLIDAATQGGANRIQGLQFSVKDEAPFRAEALKNAVKAARANAEAIAAAAGLKLGKVLLVHQDNASVIRPIPGPRAFAAAEIAPTPVEPGTIEVRASVTVSIELQ